MKEIEYRKCYPDHLKLIDTDSFKIDELKAFISPETSEYVFKHGVAKSAWVGLRCVAAAGLIPFYPGRKSVAWAVISKDIGPYMLPITKEVRRFLDEDPTPRIEMYVLSDFNAGHKWAKMLGFKCETPEGMRKHSYFGRDEFLYSRVK